MSTSSRFAAPTSSLDLDVLLHRLRKVFAVSMGIAVAIHLVAISITDPREETLPDVGLIQLEDAESGETLLVDTHDKEMTAQYAKQFQQKRSQRKTYFSSIGIDTIEILTNRSLTDPIIRYFKMREKKH